METGGLRVLMLSLHGLVKGEKPELGRDADTGGQVGYVLDLARALGRHPSVARVELVTRLIDDPSVGPDYASPREVLGPRAELVRIAFGPRRYIRKELLWPHLDQFVDRCADYVRKCDRLPHLLHSHYADAGAAGARLSQLLGIPLVHTGHSLGRTKKSRLLASGRSEAALERQFNFRLRIGAEEETLDEAKLIIASTHQEVSNQWGAYEHFRASRSLVLPPGVDTSRFSPPDSGMRHAACPLVDRFFSEARKPLVLAIARPAPKKNIVGLIEAFGRDPILRKMANLAIVAGSRDDIQGQEEPGREVLTQILLAIDRHDLWGHVAIPKRHLPEDVPMLYRVAASRGGLFVNPALTEPFGLTLLEAAASGLPVVATADGGPRDIVTNCRNGLLVDPRDPGEIGQAIRAGLSDVHRWRAWARNGLRCAHERYTWEFHARKYVHYIEKLLGRGRKAERKTRSISPSAFPERLQRVSRILVSDIDDTLLGDRKALEALLGWLEEERELTAFAVATGRNLSRAVEILKEWGVRVPDIVVSSVGTEIHYGPDLVADGAWERQIRGGWRRRALEAAFEEIPGMRPQAPEKQGRYKLSFDVSPRLMPDIEILKNRLRTLGLQARLVYSQGAFLDVLPVRASKGLAVRFLSHRLGVPLESILVAGDSGNDREMLRGDTLAVVVANHKPELDDLRGLDRILFSSRPYAGGILDGIAHYGFGSVVPSPGPLAPSSPGGLGTTRHLGGA